MQNKKAQQVIPRRLAYDCFSTNYSLCCWCLHEIVTQRRLQVDLLSFHEIMNPVLVDDDAAGFAVVAAAVLPDAARADS